MLVLAVGSYMQTSTTTVNELSEQMPDNLQTEYYMRGRAPICPKPVNQNQCRARRPRVLIANVVAPPFPCAACRGNKADNRRQ
jgi:hypothetical protein